MAIRSGGHTSPTGASSREGGLVVDLSRYLGTVAIDAENKLVYAGGTGKAHRAVLWLGASRNRQSREVLPFLQNSC